MIANCDVVDVTSVLCSNSCIAICNLHICTILTFITPPPPSPTPPFSLSLLFARTRRRRGRGAAVPATGLHLRLRRGQARECVFHGREGAPGGGGRGHTDQQRRRGLRPPPPGVSRRADRAHYGGQLPRALLGESPVRSSLQGLGWGVHGFWYSMQHLHADNQPSTFFYLSVAPELQQSLTINSVLTSICALIV